MDVRKAQRRCWPRPCQRRPIRVCSERHEVDKITSAAVDQVMRRFSCDLAKMMDAPSAGELPVLHGSYRLWEEVSE